MKELERRALMGDKEAQRECTRLGIVLICPYCKSQNVVRKVAGGDYWYACEECGAESGFEESEIKALSKWNTRPAPPIGRCKDCKHQGTGDSDICHSGMDDEFCSGFEPKEDAK